MTTEMSGGMVAIVAAVVVMVSLVAALMSRYKVAKPNEAIIVSGRKGTPQRVVIGGVFVWPVVQQYSVLDLSARRIQVEVNGVPSKQSIRMTVKAVAVIRVNAENEGSIRAAASRYLSQQDNIEADATQVLSAALRSIVGQMTVPEMTSNRESFTEKAAKATENSMNNAGLVLDSFAIQEVEDTATADKPAGSYMRDLERPEAARAQREASLAETEARRIAEQEAIRSEQALLEAQREFDLRQAAIQAETDAAKAKAEAAGPLAAAEQERFVLESRQQVAIQQAELTDRQLDAEVRKPADARRYQTEIDAEAAKTARLRKAEADREATILAAQAEAKKKELDGVGEQKQREALAAASAFELVKGGEAERNKREALAAAVKAEGEAQAASELAVGTAEAEAMMKKAAAFAQYNQAAILEMITQVLPQVAHEMAAPMSAIDNLTVVSTEGASALPAAVTSNVAQLQALLKDTVGFDISGMLEKVADGSLGAAGDRRIGQG